MSLSALAFVPVLAVAVAAAVLDSPGSGQADPCVATQPVDAAPGALALGPDRRIWFADERSDRLAAFDVDRDRVAQEIPLPSGTRAGDVTGAHDGRLWFAGRSGVLGSADPESERVVTHTVGGEPRSLVFAAGGEQVWFSDAARGALREYDVSSDGVRDHVTGLPGGNRMDGLAVAPDGDIWAALPGSDRIAQFDVARGRFERLVRFSRGSEPRQLLVLDRGEEIAPLVYVALAGNGAIGELDLETQEVEEYTTSAGSVVDVLVPLDLGLWAATADPTRLVRLDPRTKEMQEVSCGIDPRSGRPHLVLGADRSLWMGLPDGEALGSVE